MADIKISALNPASPLTGREMIPAVQDGFPVKVYVSNVPIYGVNVIEKYTNEINVDNLYPLATGYYTLQTAINAIQNNALKKSGIKMTFKTSSNVCETWQFKSSSENWLDINNWELQPKRLEISQLNTLLNSVSLLAESLSNLIKPIAENGFNVTDENGNIGMKYDGNGLDASLLSSHFQDLINGLINLAISTAKGSSIAPLVNSLIPAIYLPSFVDDVIDIDIFGKENIDKYCADNNGNTNTLTDKFCYDDIQKCFVVAKQVNNAIELTAYGSPEFGKVYIDIVSNKTYRWSGTVMVAIGSDLSLGETSATAYAGDKGKLNETNITTARSSINGLSTVLSSISSMLQQITEVGYNVADPSGNVCLKYDGNGFDTAKLSTHIISLIKSGIGNIGGNDTRLIETIEDGFFIIDDNGYILFSIDPTNGIQFAKLGTKAKEALSDAGISEGLTYTVVKTID